MGTNGMIDLKDNEFRKISQLVYRLYGIHLSEKKKALVHGRLHKIVKDGGYDSFEEYYKAVTSGEPGDGLLALVNRITTNHTYFFREPDHFHFLNDVVLPRLIDASIKTGESEARIWCAGCATGEEAYSLAFLLKEKQERYDCIRFKILATDISTSALDRARAGVYPEEKIESIPAAYRGKYLVRRPGDTFAVKEDVKRMITFRRLNLVRESFPFVRKFHVVFCRNVMIYFDMETRKRLIAAFHRYMHESGLLFVGHSEYFYGADDLFSNLHPAVYEKKRRNG